MALRTIQNRPVGTINGRAGAFLLGWVYDQHKKTPLTVDIFANDEKFITNYIANYPRPDLAEAGYGNGSFGIFVSIPPHLRADNRSIDVRVVESKTGRPLLHRKIALGRDTFSGGNPYMTRLDSVNGGGIRGWGIDIASPEKEINYRFLIDDVHFSTLKNDQERPDLANKFITEGAGGLVVEIPADRLPIGDHKIQLIAPDGEATTFTYKSPGHSTVLRSWSAGNPWDRGLTIIVPVYNAIEDVRICIDRLLQYTPRDIDILFIDDCSPDPEIWPLLQQTADRTHIRVIRNETNLGFTRTINAGIAASGDNDIIFLNSDARVTPRWTQGMRIAAYSRPRIATVTAMSDRAGAFSAPEIGNANELPPGVSEAEFAQAFRRASIGLYPEVPTGNGFCMYVRRDCIDEIGPLDAEAFPRGYGEENDFCMRAYSSGWRNIIDDRTYVFHERSKSFGEQKFDLMKAGRAIVDQRYPEYTEAIRVFSEGNHIQFARHRGRYALSEMNSGHKPLSRFLFVISTMTGGTPQTNRDLMNALDGSVEGWTLRCDSRMIQLSRITNGKLEVVRTHQLYEQVDPLSHRSAEYEAIVLQWLIEFDFDLVHIRHLGWHSLELPHLIHLCGVRSILSFHDYYLASPTVKMIDDTGVFLGNTYSQTLRENRQSLWPRNALPAPTGIFLQNWQERSLKAILQCDAFITTSESSRELLCDVFPEIPRDVFHVIPHGRDFTEFHQLDEDVDPEGPLRILVPGNIDLAKGLGIIRELVALDVGGKLEFHILGLVSKQEGPLPASIIAHGTYDREHFAGRVAAIRPHLGAIFSIWNETYCHTLTELWSVGLPALAFDFDTVAARIRKSGAGWVLDHHDVQTLYQNLIAIGRSQDEIQRKRDAVLNWQEGEGLANTTRVMASKYIPIYRDVLAGRPARITNERGPLIALVSPSGPDLRSANASTHIRVWERCLNRLDSNLNFVRMTPETLIAAIDRNELDIIIIQRDVVPMHLVGRVVEAAETAKIPYIFEMDDDLLNVAPDKDPDGRYRLYAPSLARLIEHASTVSVSTEALREKVLPLNRNVQVMPNGLSDRLWSGKAEPRAEGQTIRALYMGVPSHDEDFAAILPALERVANAVPNFKLALVGIAKAENPELFGKRWIEIIKIPSQQKNYPEFVPWLRNLAARVDFGIAPLTGATFNSYKSPLKILDYAGLGLPTLASDAPVYRDFAGRTPHLRLIPNETDAWERALLDQIAAGPRSTEVSETLRAWLDDNYLLSDIHPSFEDLLLPLLSTPDQRRSGEGE
ncbi:glycosyltransferase [Paracoccus aminophilus]|nr:glycosyltransferase [Paracoccus aminophilus]